MLEECAPPAVLVNAQGDILYVSGRTGRLPGAGCRQGQLEHPRDGPRRACAAALGAALRQALAGPARRRTARARPCARADGAAVEMIVDPIGRVHWAGTAAMAAGGLLDALRLPAGGAPAPTRTRDRVARNCGACRAAAAARPSEELQSRDAAGDAAHRTRSCCSANDRAAVHQRGAAVAPTRSSPPPRKRCRRMNEELQTRQRGAACPSSMSWRCAQRRLEATCWTAHSHRHAVPGRAQLRVRRFTAQAMTCDHPPDRQRRRAADDRPRHRAGATRRCPTTSRSRGGGRWW
jgi:hypothetical protein